MEEIDQKLDQWVYNSIIRAEIRSLIVSAIHTHAKKVVEDQLLDVKVESFKAGWIKSEANNEAIRINKLSYE
mgnify:CR=1 FL=1